MTFNGADFLRVARLLFQQSPDEGCDRSSISRAYYAAFHSARDYCESIDVSISRKNSHVEVRWCLESQRHGHLADDLRTLHDWRKYADYDVPFPQENVSEVATDALSIAESILDRLNASRA